MPQRLPIVPAQLIASKTYKNILNKLRQIIFSCSEQKKSLKSI